jgi:predicted enzyme related to lactoylglutathione lyase
MDKNTNALNWFEIPVTDLPRAKHFYQVIFGIHMDEMEMEGMQMAVFPGDPRGGLVYGGLAKSEMHIPSADGVIVYLNADPDLENVLSKVEEMGGKVAMPKTQISPEIGYMAFFIDTEGNKIGLHSRN